MQVHLHLLGDHLVAHQLRMSRQLMRRRLLLLLLLLRMHSTSSDRASGCIIVDHTMSTHQRGVHTSHVLLLLHLQLLLMLVLHLMHVLLLHLLLLHHLLHLQQRRITTLLRRLLLLLLQILHDMRRLSRYRLSRFRVLRSLRFGSLTSCCSATSSIKLEDFNTKLTSNSCLVTYCKEY